MKRKLTRAKRARAPISHVLISIAIFAAAAYAAYRWCYLPDRCNVFKRSAESAIMATDVLASPRRRANLAGVNLERSLQWIDRCPDDLEIYMIAAASQRELGRSMQAVAMYQRAAELDRRPEIYLNLGEAQAEAGLTDDAIPSLAAAVMFDPNLMTEVPPLLRQRVQDYVKKQTAL